MRRARLAGPAVAALFVLACGGDTGDPKVGECEDYCLLMTEHCSGTVSQYSDRSSCLATCAAMPLGDPTTHAGNTIACRTFQAAAAELTPATTCVLAGPGGHGTCGGDCESFCALADEICAGSLAAYDSTSACMTACAGFPLAPPFDSGDQGGDSFECRLYHLTAASVDPNFHCPHIGVVSPVCN